MACVPPAGLDRRTQCDGIAAVDPPSTGMIAPVMKHASSESRKAMLVATSSGRPSRPIGWDARMRLTFSDAEWFCCLGPQPPQGVIIASR